MRNRLRNIVSSRTASGQRVQSRQARRRLMAFESMEERRLLASISLTDGVLSIEYVNASEKVTVQNNGTLITVAAFVGSTPTGLGSFLTSQVSRIVVNDTAETDSQSLEVVGTAPFVLGGGFIANDIETVKFLNDVQVTGNSTIEVLGTDSGGVDVDADLLSDSGFIHIIGGSLFVSHGIRSNQGGNIILIGNSNSHLVAGVSINGDASVSTTQDGYVFIRGTADGGNGGAGASIFGNIQTANGQINLYGTTAGNISSTGLDFDGNASTIAGDVFLDGRSEYAAVNSAFNVGLKLSGGEISSLNGAVSLLGRSAISTVPGVSNWGILKTGANTTLNAANGVTIRTDSIQLESGNLDAGNSVVRLETDASLTKINLGGETVFGGPERALGITNSDLEKITASMLVVGSDDDLGTGTISVSQHISPTNFDTLSLRSRAEVNSSGIGRISVSHLAVRSRTGISLDGDNDVNHLAVFNEDVGSVSLKDTNGFSIGEIDEVSGINNSGIATTTSGGPIYLNATAGTITIVDPVITNDNHVIQIIAGQTVNVQDVLYGGAGVFVQGRGLASSLSDGVVIGADGGIFSNTGNINVLGNGGGAASGIGADGVSINGGSIASVSGNINVTGSGGSGSGSSHRGVLINSSGSINSSGNISVNGTGGTGASGNAKYGVVLSNGSIYSYGTGTVTIVGTGGSGNGSNLSGIHMSNSSHVFTDLGLLSITGRGGTGTGELNYGIFVNESRIGDTVGPGNVVVVGEGRGGTESNDVANGIYLTGPNAQVTSGGGAILIVGTSWFSGYGLALDNGARIQSGGNAPITLNVDALGIMDVASDRINAGTGTVNIRTSQPFTPIVLGGDDVPTQTPKLLGLSSNELSQVVAGTLVIGDSSIQTPTSISVVSDLTLPSVSNLELRAISIHIDSSLAVNETASVLLRAQGTVSISADVTGGAGGLDVYGFGVSDQNSTGVLVSNGAVVTAASGGDIYIYGKGRATTFGGNRGVEITAGSQVLSMGGEIEIEGIGGGTGNSSNNHGVAFSVGGQLVGDSNAPVVVHGTGGMADGTFNTGVFVVGAGSGIIAQGAPITVIGQGGGTQSSGSNRGVWVGSGAKIENVSANGLGSVYIEGLGGQGTGGFNRGVYIENTNTRVASSTNDVTIFGVGNGTEASSNNYGIQLNSGAIVSAGPMRSVIMNGTGKAGGGSNNVGIWISGSSTQVLAENGQIKLEAMGGPASTALVVNGRIDSGTSSNIELVADSIAVSGTSERLIFAENGTVVVRPRSTGLPIDIGGEDILDGLTKRLGISDAEIDKISTSNLVIGGIDTGDIEVTDSTQPAGAKFLDVRSGDSIRVNASIDSANGGGLRLEAAHTLSILAEITGGSLGTTIIGNGTSASNSAGVIVDSLLGNGRVTGEEGGDVVIVGTGNGGAGGFIHGVHIRGNGGSGPPSVSSDGGSISVTGTGGNGLSASNHGVRLSFGGSIATTNFGSVNVVGTGGANSPGALGVLIENAESRIASTGSIAVEGSGVAGGVVLRSLGALVSEWGSSIAIATDSLVIDGPDANSLGLIQTPDGLVSIAPQTSGTELRIGGADVLTGVTRALGLTNVELNRITAGALHLGDSDTGRVSNSMFHTFDYEQVVIRNGIADVEAIGGWTFTGDLFLESEASIYQGNNELSVAGLADFRAAGSVMLDGMGDPDGNQFNDVYVSGDTIVIRESQDGFNLSGAEIGTLLTIATPFAVTQTAPLSGTGGITLTTESILILDQVNTFAGLTTIGDSALLVVDDELLGNVLLMAGGMLAGSGNIAGNVSGIGVLKPGSNFGNDIGILTLGGTIALVGEMDFQVVETTTAGTDYDQLVVAQSVDLSNVTGLFFGSIAREASQSILVIDNQSATATVPFSNLAEGASVVINDIAFTISYIGGDGNDVVLEPVETNLPPTAVRLENVLSEINENALLVNRIKVADIVIDDDELGENQLSLSGPQLVNFEIDGLELFLRAGTQLDYETLAALQITISVDDTAVGATPDASVNYTLTLLDLAEVANVAVGDGTAQRSRVDQLVITFDGEVDVAASAFAVHRRSLDSDTGGVVNSSFSTQVINGATVATVTFSGISTRGDGALIDGNYELRIDASKITRDGNALDGDRDGINGGNYEYGTESTDAFFSLYGDLNGDRMVSLAEFNAFRAAFGKNSTQAGYSRELDYDDDNAIGLSDFNQFRNRFGKQLLFQ